MFYLDAETGDLETTNDYQKTRRHLVAVNALSHRYGLDPTVVGDLHELLGPVDPNMARRDAINRVKRVLRNMGLDDLPVDAVVETLGDGWRTLITVDQP